MATSFGQSHNTENHPFGVLDQQVVEPKYGGNTSGTNIPIKLDQGFSQIPGFVQPTDLDLSVVKEPSEKTQGTEASASPASSESIEAQDKQIEKFVPPEQIIFEINNLIISGRKLRSLGFDIVESSSNEQVRGYLDNAFNGQLITQPERQKMLGFLSDEAKAEVQGESVPESVVAEQSHPESKSEKLAKLKENHGIVVESVATHEQTPLEKGIIEKAGKLFDKTYPDETTVSPAVEAREEKVVEEVPSDVPAQPEVIEKPISGKYVFPVQFAGRKISIVRGEGDGSDDATIKVFWGGEEIARGKITEEGQEITLDPEFKGGLLGEKTMEQKAFERVLPAIKTLRLPA